MKSAPLAVLALAVFALAACSKKVGEKAVEALPVPEAMSAPAAAPPITSEGLKAHIKMLSSDEFAGRAPASPGGEKARRYIASEFERLGLEPIGASYFQEVPLVESNVVPDQSFFKLQGADGLSDLKYKTDIVYWTKQVAEGVAFEKSDVVFVGYGIVAPEYQWNDYAGVDVKGKTVVILINDPGYATGNPELFTGKAMTYYGRWTYKYEEAARQGAAAALIVHDTGPAAYGWNVVESSWSGPQIDLKRADDGASRVKVEAWISNDAAKKLLTRANLNYDALLEAAKTRGFTAVPLTGVTASAKVTNAIRRSADANVVGVLPGAEAPHEYVLYTAHWDHLGDDPAAGGEDHIFNGAVDNATGVAAILEIAEKFAAGPRPRRSIMFAAVTGEESGLLGSAYMAESPPVPLKDIVAGVNIDGMLPTPKARDVIVVGAGKSELEDILKKKTDARGLYIRPDTEPEKGYFYRSDHISFAKKGVPMLYADSGYDLVDGGETAGRALLDAYTAERYHQPSDEYDESWDLSAMADTVDMLQEVGAEIATSDKWPTWRDGDEFRAIRDASRAE
ncbi:MAG: M28 family metallopeptidase [Parvularculaceae bacterium]